jgi:hypothetical protein
MFSLIGLAALLVAQYTKLHEVVPALRAAPVTHLIYIAACLGVLLDLRLRLVRLDISPLVLVAISLVLWSVAWVPLTGGSLGTQVNLTLAYFLAFFVVAQK